MDKEKKAVEKLYLPYDSIMSEGTLIDWYISSVSEDDTPVWTDEHIEELCNDYYVIPKEVSPVSTCCKPTGMWVPLGKKPTKEWVCTNCKGIVKLPVYADDCYYNYCPNCGAIMSTCENENTNIEPDTKMALKYYLTLAMAKITNPDSNNMIEYDDNDNPHWEYEKEVNELLKRI